jgi:hypothetical protein
MEVSFYNPSGTKYLYVAARFLELLWTNDLLPTSVFLEVFVFKTIKERGASRIQ